MALPIVRRDAVPPGEEAEFLKFLCPPRFQGGPFDAQPPTRIVHRRLDANIQLPLPPSVARRTRAGRGDVVVWVIEDPDLPYDVGRVFPSPIIRTVEGDTVHAHVGFSLNDHTIHWHGIEPTPLNDGVGHLSFEATSPFVYQFTTRHPGTYFYHCHKNTVLHFEMGLYGLLVVDARNPNRADRNQALYRTGGPGWVAANLSQFTGFPGFDPEHLVAHYDVEALWVPDEFDSLWHDLPHEAFMQKCDANDPLNADTFSREGFLNDFQPDIFLITGVVSEPTTRPGVRPEIGAVIRDPRVAVTARRGQTILIRLLNAGYTTQEYRLGMDAIVIASDGHAEAIPPFSQYSFPFAFAAGQPFRLTTARRVDVLAHADTVGEFPFTVGFYDWAHGPDSPFPLLYHVARTVIRVRP